MTKDRRDDREEEFDDRQGYLLLAGWDWQLIAARMAFATSMASHNVQKIDGYLILNS